MRLLLLVLLLAPAVPAQGSGEVRLAAERDAYYRAPGLAAAVVLFATSEGAPSPRVRVVHLETNETALTNSRGLAIFSFKHDEPTAERARFALVGRESTPIEVRLVWTEAAASLEPAARVQAVAGEAAEVHVVARATVDGSALAGANVTLDAGEELMREVTDAEGRARFQLHSERARMMSLHATVHATDLGLPRDAEARGVAAWTRPLGPDAPPPPIARVEAPTTLLAREPATWNASGSVGDIVAYLFEPGDGTSRLLSQSPSFVHAYAQPGTYAASLRAVDAYGRESDPVQLEHRVLLNLTFRILVAEPPAYREEAVQARGTIESPERGVRRVEASLDGAPWRELGAGPEWALRWPGPVDAGPHTLVVRAFDGAGEATEERLSFDVRAPTPAVGGGLLLAVVALAVFFTRGAKKA
jgi:hypothetical protein